MGKGHRGTSCSKCSVASDQAVLEKSVPSNWLILTASPSSAQEGEYCNAHLNKATIRCMMCMMGVCVYILLSLSKFIFQKNVNIPAIQVILTAILPYPAISCLSSACSAMALISFSFRSRRFAIAQAIFAKS